MTNSTEISVSLPPALLDFAKAEVEAGRYRTVDDVVCDGLRQMKRREDRFFDQLAILRAWAEEGVREYEETGGDPVDGESFLDQLEADLNQDRKKSA